MYPRIRALREDHDLSQRQVAEMLGMSQTGYSKYETGENDIPTAVLIKLSTFYHTSVDYLLGLTPVSSPYPTTKYTNIKKWLPHRQPLFISYSGKNLTSRSRRRPSWP